MLPEQLSSGTHSPSLFLKYPAWQTQALTQEPSVIDGHAIGLFL